VLDELERAVAEQLMSDVPLGVFLSGGIDSSMITRLLANRRSLDQIDAFSIGFEDSSFDESEFAREAASAIGVRWHHRVFQASDLLARIPKIAAHLDEPFADPSLLPVSLLSEFARQHVTVALGGDGGDELFAGYDPFLAVAPARWIRRLGFVGQAFLRAFSDWIPSSDKNMGLRFRFERLLRGVEVPIELQCAAWMGPFSWTSLRRLCPELVSGVEIQRAFPEELAWLHQALDRNRMDDMTLALDFFQRIYLPDDILVKVDRASMMHSLEVRCPFLDRELVTLANQLPIQAKIAGRQTKVLFKQEIKRRNLLPERITNRSKKGFGIPIAAWLKRELKGAFEERVIHGWPRDLPPLVATELHRLWEEHLSGRRNNYKELWALLMLAWWRQSHGENRALASD
jgi:asparagine synthase (glutamine-hydrolysing)